MLYVIYAKPAGQTPFSLTPFDSVLGFHPSRRSISVVTAPSLPVRATGAPTGEASGDTGEAV